MFQSSNLPGEGRTLQLIARKSGVPNEGEPKIVIGNK